MLQPPRRCFCQVASRDLQHWARQRFEAGLTTPELLERTDGTEQRELITLVALLNADRHLLLEAMSQVHLPYTHILRCRDRTRALLKLPALASSD